MPINNYELIQNTNTGQEEYNKKRKTKINTTYYLAILFCPLYICSDNIKISLLEKV